MGRKVVAEGMRKVADGIIDRRFNPDGSDSDYIGNRPFRVDLHFSEDGREIRKSKCFQHLKDAKAFRARRYADHLHWDDPDYKAQLEAKLLRNKDVTELLNEFMNRRGERLGYSDRKSIEKFIGTARLAQKSLYEVNGETHLFAQYFEDMKNSTFKLDNWKGPERQYKASTVPRLRAILRVAFREAITWNYFDICKRLQNPVSGIPISGATRRKYRTSTLPELRFLTLAFERSLRPNTYYGPLALFLCLETGLRLEEMVDLLWSDVDFASRRIAIRWDKTSRKKLDKGLQPGRSVVMTIDALAYLGELRHSITTDYCLPDGSVMPGLNCNEDTYIFLNRHGNRMTAEALADVFTKTVKRAGIGRDEYDESFTFHCIRRTANIEFEKADLDQRQRDIMLGHAIKGMDEVYQDRTKEHVLKVIQDKLDAAKLVRLGQNQTLKEALRLHSAYPSMTSADIGETGEVPLLIPDSATGKYKKYETRWQRSQRAARAFGPRIQTN